MASGGRRGAGERVLESRHVIGLFLLMLVFSGVFFALGYVMGRNQYDGQVRAANNGMGIFDPVPSAKPDVAPKKTVTPVKDSTDSDPATSNPSDSTWNFYDKDKSAKVAPHLEPVPKTSPTPPQSKRLSLGRTTPRPWQTVCRKNISPRTCSRRTKTNITACRSGRSKTRRVPTPRRKAWRTPASRHSS